MRFFIIFLLNIIIVFSVNAQRTVWSTLQEAWQKISSDGQLKYADAGICVMDAATGKLLFEKNSERGMTPASTQKIITSIAAFEALGASYTYTTKLGYTGSIIDAKLNGNIVVQGSGDPTLASWRYAATKENKVLSAIGEALVANNITSINGDLLGTDNGFDINPIPKGWTWGDMGNYYGTGHWGINWKENQYDIYNNTGKVENASVEIANGEEEQLPFDTFINNVKTGKPNTGDASIVYASPFSQLALFQGELEPGKKKYMVSGSVPTADLFALNTINRFLAVKNIALLGKVKPRVTQLINNESNAYEIKNILTITSPALDSINYWLMKKSVNLYAEALLRTIGLEKYGFGSTKSGLMWVDSFYVANGIENNAMHLCDGSGLSPENSIAPLAMCKALYMVQSKPWFKYFYDALPLYNGMKLKSGTINRVKCFAGYHTSTQGRKFIVTLMVNNYNGSSAGIVQKMFAVLNCLK